MGGIEVTKIAYAFIVGAVVAVGAIYVTKIQDAVAQTVPQASGFQIAQTGTYPQPGAWQINTATGAMKFCTVLNTGWQCLPVAGSAN
jgi:hypothetical protein